jgi:hypothetical protein
VLAADCNRNGVEDALDLLPSAGFERTDDLSAYLQWDGPSAADLDGDGRDELVSSALEALAVVGLDEDGRFTARYHRFRLVECRRRMTAVELGDLDGDGALDALAIEPCQLGLATVFSGDGRGGFSERQRLDLGIFPLGIFPLGLSLADLDGDGRLDAIINGFQFDPSSFVADFRGALVFLNDGRGAFSAAPHPQVATADSLLDKLYTGPIDATFHTRAGDVDGDGRLDLVSTIPGSAFVSVLAGLGGGRFEAAPRFFRTGIGPRDLALADFDRDGRLDVATANVTGSLSFLFQEAGGGFAAPVTVPSTRYPSRIRAADVDGDGDADLLSDSETPVLLNRGDGSFESGFDVVYLEQLLDETVEVQGFLTLDFDGDGDLDLAGRLRFEGDRMYFLENTGGGAYRLLRYVALGGSPRPLAAADFDRDGRADLAAGFLVSGEIAIFHQDEQGRFSKATSLIRSDFTSTGAVLAADVDGDADADLVLSPAEFVLGEPRGAIQVHYNDGGGGFSRSASFAAAGGAPELLEAADVDADGDLDLLAAGGFPGAAMVFFNAGGGAFPESSRLELSEVPRALAAFDVDGDRFAEILLGESHRVRILRPRGGAPLESSRTLPLQGTPQDLAGADLDGDGDLDLATLNLAESGSGEVSLSILFNEGGGEFSTARNLFAGRRGGWLAVVDDDADGAPDLATLTSGELRIFYNRERAGVFEAHQFGTYFFDPTAFAAADFDGDGALDFALTDAHLQAPAIFARRHYPAFSRDLDGDGAPDECRPEPFRRGDVLADGQLNVSDAALLLRHAFIGGLPFTCYEAGDVDNDGNFAPTDAVLILAYLFLRGPPPAPPGPPPGPCGLDPDPRGTALDLTCADDAACD